jgi:hypothetical protein
MCNKGTKRIIHMSVSSNRAFASLRQTLRQVFSAEDDFSGFVADERRRFPAQSAAMGAIATMTCLSGSIGPI